MDRRNPANRDAIWRLSAGLVLAIALALNAAPASAQRGERQDSVGTDAVDAVTQPLSDLNLRSRTIPLILRLAQHAPYDLTSLDDCSAIAGEIHRLEEVLGPDADAEQRGPGLVNRGLQAGGEVLGDMIPFRSLFRRLSGARANRQRLDLAIYAGIARRSFLKGLALGRNCSAAESETALSAEQILGLDPEQ